MKGKVEIKINSQYCTGCLTCALQCSFKDGQFNPMKANIRIVTFYEKPNEIEFTDDCDHCGICARSCPYGALEIIKDDIKK